MSIKNYDDLKSAIINSEIISFSNFVEIAEYMNKYPKDFVFQYNVTPGWLIDEYRVTKYKEQIIIFKTKPFLKYKVTQIEMLPLNIDIQEFISEANKLGFYTRISDFEFAKNNIALNKKVWKLVDTAKGDFVYSRFNNLKIDGKENESLRLGINRFEKNSDFEITFIKPSEFNYKIKQELLNLIETYIAMKKASGNKSSFTFHIRKYVNIFENWKTEFNEQRALQLVRYQGKIKAFSISEKMNEFNVSMPDRKMILSDIPKMQHAFRAVNYFDIKYWADRASHNNEIYYNFGSAGDSKDLFETKTRMHPERIMLVYKQKDKLELDTDLENFKLFEHIKKEKAQDKTTPSIFG